MWRPPLPRADLAPVAVQVVERGGLTHQAGGLRGRMDAGIVPTGKGLGNSRIIAFEAGNPVGWIPTIFQHTFGRLKSL
jgi:hypothetical protein